MKTIEEAKKAKHELEDKISFLLDEYSQQYNCIINNISITQIFTGMDIAKNKIDIDIKL